MKKKTAILEAIHPAGIEHLETFSDVSLLLGLPREILLKQLTLFDAIVVKSVTEVDGALLDAAPQLQVIGRAGTGVDNIDLSAAKDRGIEVVTVPTGNTISAAEFTIGLMLELCKRFPEAFDAIRQGDYRRQYLEGRELRKMTVGLVGLGNVGAEVAKRLSAFGCHLLAYEPDTAQRKNRDLLEGLGGEWVDSLENLFSQSDMVSLHANLTSNNRHMINQAVFNGAKPGLFLINTARGALIDDAALLVALEKGQVSGAAVDVLYPEPPYDAMPGEKVYTHPFLNHPKIIVTPHMAASTLDAQEAIARQLAASMEKHFKVKTAIGV